MNSEIPVQGSAATEDADKQLMQPPTKYTLAHYKGNVSAGRRSTHKRKRSRGGGPGDGGVAVKARTAGMRTSGTRARPNDPAAILGQVGDVL